MRGLFYVLVLIFSLTAFDSHAQQCARLFDQTSLSSAQKSDQLKVGTYNLLNLYLHAGNVRKANSGPHQKPRWAIEQMGSLLKEENYDIFIAQEVESIGSAKKFNEEYLDNQYNVFSTTTKDIRGLFVVFFVKKSLPFHYKIESHSNEMWFDTLRNQESPVFERDLPTLHIYKNKNDKIPMLTMLGAHFKSKRDRFGPRDPATNESEVETESNRLREVQANRATQIIQRYQIQFGYEHPILIAGDFNSNHNYAPEFVGFLRHAKLSDTIGMKRKIEKYSDRTTHSYFGGQSPKHNQLDGVLVTPSLAEFLMDSYVVAYKDEDGAQKDIPRTKDERKRNPSDHRPVTAIFSLGLLTKR
jgi:hypothetical protein